MGWKLWMVTHVCMLFKTPWFFSPLFNLVYNYCPKRPFLFFPHSLPHSYKIFWNSCLMVIGVSLLGCYGCGFLFIALLVLSACVVTGPYAFPVLPLPRYVITPLCTIWVCLHCFETVFLFYFFLFYSPVLGAGGEKKQKDQAKIQFESEVRTPNQDL